LRHSSFFVFVLDFWAFVVPSLFFPLILESLGLIHASADQYPDLEARTTCRSCELARLELTFASSFHPSRPTASRSDLRRRKSDCVATPAQATHAGSAPVHRSMICPCGEEQTACGVAKARTMLGRWSHACTRRNASDGRPAVEAQSTEPSCSPSVLAHLVRLRCSGPEVSSIRGEPMRERAQRRSARPSWTRSPPRQLANSGPRSVSLYCA
jgi:hypothetical protein